MTGQSTKEMVFEDINKTRSEPVLAVLANPNNEYFKALVMFRNRIAVGVADYDTLVPAASATICAGTSKQDMLKDNFKVLEKESVFEPIPMDCRYD